MADAKSVAQTVATIPTKHDVSTPAAPVMKPVEEEGNWKTFIWNQKKKQLFGRTIPSWILITIFYVIFFICLFSFFLLSWLVALSFINPHTPYKQGERAILGHKGPGFSVRPVPDRHRNDESALIWFTPGVRNGWVFWANQLQTWFKYMPKVDGKSVKKCFDEGEITQGMFLQNTSSSSGEQSCFVDPKWFGSCSGEKDSEFGYEVGEPCILIKLNRIHGWSPEPFEYKDWEAANNTRKLKVAFGSHESEVEVPQALVNYVLKGGKPTEGGGTGTTDNKLPPESAPSVVPSSNDTTEETATSPSETGGGAPAGTSTTFGKHVGKYVVVWCDGEHDHDKEILGSIEYYPGPYIPAALFPFNGQTNYQTPFLMIQLKRPVAGALVSIVCQAYAKNIVPTRESGTGYVRFQVLVG